MGEYQAINKSNMRKSQIISIAVILVILSIQSCDPNFGIGVKNNTRDTLYFRTGNYFDSGQLSMDTLLQKDTMLLRIYMKQHPFYALHKSGIEWNMDTVLAGKLKIFSWTGGMYHVHLYDIPFNYMQLIQHNDTVSVSGRDNIFKWFGRDKDFDNFIVVKEDTFKK